MLHTQFSIATISRRLQWRIEASLHLKVVVHQVDNFGIGQRYAKEKQVVNIGDESVAAK